jgi:Ni/Fe-hydrogenase subunit HybB-like protein
VFPSMTKGEIVGRLVVVIDVNPSHGFWTTRLIKVFGHEGQCTCIYNTHEWIVYIMLFPMVCGTSCGSSWLRRSEFLKMTK